MCSNALSIETPREPVDYNMRLGRPAMAGPGSGRRVARGRQRGGRGAPRPAGRPRRQDLAEGPALDGRERLEHAVVAADALAPEDRAHGVGDAGAGELVLATVGPQQ